MKPRQIFWTTILLIAVIGIGGCPLPPQQKGAAPQQKEAGPAPQPERAPVERTE